VRQLLRRFLAPYSRPLVLVAVLLLIQAIGNLYLPELNARIINEGVAVGDTAYIIRVGGVMLAVTLVLGATAIVSTYWSARVSMGFGRDVRSSLFGTVQTFSAREVNEFGTPSLITRNTNDVQQLQMLVLMGLTVMLTAPIMCIGGIVMALRQDVPLSALLLVIVPLMAVIIGLLMSRAIPLFRVMQVKIDRVNQVLREQLSGIRVIRAFVRTEHEERRFADANADLTSTALTVNRLFALMMPSLMLIMNLSGVAVIWFGGQRVDSGDMPIGNLTAFLAYIIQILMSVMMATMMFVMVPRAAASAERIGAVLDVVPTVSDPDSPQAPTGRGTVEFRDVEFRYPGAEEAVLRGVSFLAAPGETTAIVGSTGSGKTTLVALVPRLFDVTSGAVLVDGVDVRELARADLWSRIGLVPQRAFLFRGTVGSNLRVGRPDATDEELWHALAVAQAAEFVRAMPEGLDAPIDQGGANLSGGQRQRIAIARALVRRPEVYVFDDSFSALDFATDARLRAALRRETGDSTVLVVAQRVSTIMHADRIVVLDEGAVAGIGRHSDLMATCPTYREIVLSQVTEEDAA
jgi:ATP-binding cassette, subfamily B, multidrug efflux pump